MQQTVIELHPPRTPSQPAHRFRLHLLAAALRGALLSAGLSGVGMAGAQAAEVAKAADAKHSYAIAAGPLSQALYQFASEAGITLSFAPALAEGLLSPGLQGRYALQDGLAALLAGSDLHAIPGATGGYLLRKAGAEAGTAPQVLPAVKVMERRAHDGTTEGSGSYTSRVTSIASKSDQSFREIPQSVSVVTRQQMDDQRLVDISDTLKLTPGIVANRASFNAYNFYSRGFQITSMQIDGGSPLALGAFSYDAQQDMAFYDRMEVMRGASGLLGGIGDPGGIINLARKKPLAERQIITEASLGRWNNRRATVDMTGPLADEGRLRGRAVAVYEQRDYHLDDRSVEKPQLYGVLEADLGRSSLLTVGASYGRQNDNGYGSGLPRYSDGRNIGLPRSASLTQPWAFNDRTASEVFGQFEHQFANRWKLKVNLTHSNMDIISDTAFANGAVDPKTGQGPLWGGGRYEVKNRQDVADISLSGTFAVLGRTHEFLAGVDWQRVKARWGTGKPVDNWAVPADVFHRNAWNPDLDVPLSYVFEPWTQEQKAVYGMLRLHPTDRLHLIAGARASRYSFGQVTYLADEQGVLQLDTDTPFSEPTKLTPYGGVIVDVSDKWSAYLSYSSIFKPQALLKAAPLPGTSLPPIRGKSIEAGLKGELMDGLLNATLSVFDVQRTGTGVQDMRYPYTEYPFAGNCCYLAQGKVTSRGVDMELGGELGTGWQGTAGYTYNQTKDESTHTDYSSITPRHMLKVTTAYALPGALSQWKVGGNAIIQSSTYVAGKVDGKAYDFTQGGYAVVGLMAQYRIDPRWTLSLNVNNLFDRVYYERVGSVTNANYYGTPRNWQLTLRGQF